MLHKIYIFTLAVFMVLANPVNAAKQIEGRAPDLPPLQPVLDAAEPNLRQNINRVDPLNPLIPSGVLKESEENQAQEENTNIAQQPERNKGQTKFVAIIVAFMSLFALGFWYAKRRKK